jgi:DNA-binding NarL/FixJ family response regulator
MSRDGFFIARFVRSFVMATIRVLLVEDNRLLRDGATAILNAQADIRAVPVSGTNGDAIAKARAFKPHVVLLDLGLRNMNSVRIVQSLRKELPKTEIIVMDLIPAHADVAEFVKEGVSGFILKDATLDDFLRAIRSVASGVKVLPPPLTGSLFSQIVEHALKTGNPKKIVKAVVMTKREQEVIELIAKGQSNKQIAEKMFIAVHTVKSHVHNILEKLALHTRLELAHHTFKTEEAKKLA